MSEFNLEERSFENLVHFFSPELKRILDGERATLFLTTCRRRRLIKQGVLVYRGGNPNKFIVSEKAKETLESLALEVVQSEEDLKP